VIRTLPLALVVALVAVTGATGAVAATDALAATTTAQSPTRGTAPSGSAPLGAAAKSFPAVGVLTPGVSLAGLRLGDTPGQVARRWGPGYKVCPKAQCKGSDTVWFYVYSHGEPLGAAVRFGKAGKVVAVFTLGSPTGWKTHEGLQLGAAVEDAYRIYGQNLRWSACLGYAAISMRNAAAVTSIYTSGDNVYGFAITAPGIPICQ
jgi:hypothetical protein